MLESIAPGVLNDSWLSTHQSVFTRKVSDGLGGHQPNEGAADELVSCDFLGHVQHESLIVRFHFRE